MTDLAELLIRVRACTLCAPHLPAGPRPVLQAHADARILIAGQAPGRRVHESGVPFQDPSGDRLRRWMGVRDEVFYDPTKIAIVPMGFCYPGSTKSGDKPPRRECAPAWREELLSRLPRVELTLVLGRYAQAYHLPAEEGGVTGALARWRSYWPGALPLPHPSPRNIAWFKKNPWFEDDVLPALQARVAELLG